MRSVAIVDRLEGNTAVVELEGRTFTLPRALLPKDTEEGDVLRFTVEVDRAATEKRRNRVKSLEDRLFRK